MAFEPTRSVPEPYKEVKRLFHEFVAKASQLMRVEGFDIESAVYEKRMLLYVRLREFPPDHPTIILKDE